MRISQGLGVAEAVVICKEGRVMRFLDWNMGWGANIGKAIEGINRVIQEKSFVITLQEIGESKSQALYNEFGSSCNIAYSMNYRPRGKREPQNRDLGIMIITSKEIEILHAEVLNNALLPERTLYVEVKSGDTLLKIMSLHSITGCDHKRAKSLQFFAFADAIDKYQPDIVSFDANEPEVDAVTVEKMKFYDNKDGGAGAKEFFKSLGDNGLSDAFLRVLDGGCGVNNPIAVSHIVNRKGPVRYDFIFINKESVEVENVEYKLEEAQAATGDHAFVIMDYTIH